MSKLRIDEDLVRKLAALLEETGLTELEVSEGESSLRVARGTTVVAGPAPQTGAAPPPPPGAQPAAAGGTPLDASHPGAVTSPMVGIAYTREEPAAPPYVQVGDTVAEGQTLLLIEAMKTFNQVRTPRAGKVTHILVEDGAPVEYGELLMIVE